MNKSVFRKNLIEACQSCFNKFFESEERQKLNDPEKSILFKDRLFGNLEFVGELFRRNILSESTLNGIFGQLTDEVCDFTIEGAIVLMNKIGFNFEEHCKKKAEKNPTGDNNFKLIIAKFEKIVNEYDQTIAKIEQVFVKADTGKKEVLTETQYMAFYKDSQKVFSQDQWGNNTEPLTDEQILKGFKTQANDNQCISKIKSINLASVNLVRISNRIKMIMRNMFEDFKTGWETSKKKNEEGPKKIAEVREEVADKYEAERQAQDASRKNDRRGYNNDGDYNDRRNNNRNQEQRYQKKDSHKNQGGIPYGKGGQEKRGDRNNNNRNDRNKKQEKEEIVIEEISEEDMCKKVSKNFEEFVLKKQNEGDQPE